MSYKIKLPIFIFFINIATITFSQNLLKGYILCAETKDAIPHVSIYIDNTGIGTLSNKDGYFEIFIPHDKKNKNIIIDDIRYSQKIINNYELIDTINTIFLEKRYYNIQTICVSANTPENILLSAVENSFKNLSSPILLNTYYKESVKVNNEYIKFADGLIKFYLKRVSNKVKKKTDITVSRAYEVNAYKNKYAQNLTSIFGVNGSTSGYSIIDYNPFKRKNFHKYKYDVEYKEDSITNYTIIRLSPLEFSKNNNKEMIITIDSKKNLILKIESKLYNSNTLPLFGTKSNITSLNFTIKYKFINEKYMLYSESKNATIKFNFASIKDNWYFESILVVTDYQTENIKMDKIKKYKYRSLYENGNEYISEFWKNNNAIQLTKEEEKIIKSLDN